MKTASQNSFSEIIGSFVEVKRHPNPFTKGIKGFVLNETMKTLNLEGSIVPKKNSVLEVNGSIIEGNSLIERPEERI